MMRFNVNNKVQKIQQMQHHLKFKLDKKGGSDLSFP